MKIILHFPFQTGKLLVPLKLTPESRHYFSSIDTAFHYIIHTWSGARMSKRSALRVA